MISPAEQLPIETENHGAGITWQAAMIWAEILLDAVDREEAARFARGKDKGTFKATTKAATK